MHANSFSAELTSHPHRARVMYRRQKLTFLQRDLDLKFSRKAFNVKLSSKSCWILRVVQHFGKHRSCHLQGNPSTSQHRHSSPEHGESVFLLEVGMYNMTFLHTNFQTSGIAHNAVFSGFVCSQSCLTRQSIWNHKKCTSIIDISLQIAVALLEWHGRIFPITSVNITAEIVRICSCTALY
jgi:hypothetical protein